MKTLNKLILAVSAMLFFSGCESNGKKYDFNGKQNIYYKGDGVSESDAKKLATYLNEIKYFGSDKELSVQITKEKETKDTVNINFVVDKSKLTEEIETSFMLIGGYIAQNVFSGTPVNINFIDTAFKLIKKLGYAKPIIDEPVAPGPPPPPVD